MRGTLSERLWARVDKKGPLPAARPDLGHCWLWTGVASGHGYGQISRVVDGQQKRPGVHRVAYELCVGPIPVGMTIDHLCRVRHCVNPQHMEVVTSRENILRGETLAAANAAKTECSKGHPYTPANTRIYAGRRWCRACNNERPRRGKK